MKRFLSLLPLLVLAGCATPPDETVIPFNAEQTKTLYAKARPPQVFGLTVYNSDNGPFFAGAGRLHQGEKAEMPFLQLILWLELHSTYLQENRKFIILMADFPGQQ